MRVALLGPWTAAPLDRWLGDAAGRVPVGSRGVVVSCLAAALLDAGHEVQVVALDEEVDAPLSVERGPLRVLLLPRRSGGRGRDAYAVERRWLRRALRDVDADVVHAHWTYEYALASTSHPAPRVVTAHDWPPRVLWYSPDPYRLVRLGMAAAALARRPALTVPSPVMARRLRRVGLRHVDVVPNGIPDDRIAAAPRTAPGRRLLAVADGFGRLKNTRVLIDALPLVRERLPGTTLTLLGPQHGRAGPARDHADAHGLLAGLDLVGPVAHQRVLAEMARADVLVHPAREESFGMVLVEAMACGTPVIGGRGAGAVPWVLDGGRVGPLVDMRSAAEVADAVVRLLGDADRWAACSAAGLEAVRARFAMSSVAAAYVGVYEAAIRRAGGR